MKRRNMKGIPKIVVVFGEPDDNPFAPLHRRLGIRTHVHRQAILDDPRHRVYDWVSRAWSNQHIFRENITLAGAA